MYLIVGLGNPGKQYEGTRHNVGFDAIDYLADKYNIDINRVKFKGICGEGIINGNKVILLKPTTYMNLSGESIREFINFYKLDNEKIVVLYDDISMPVGKIRIRPKGSAGGHNGVKSIIQNLGSEIFPRIKIGVGQPEYDLVSHVLGKFEASDREILSKVLPVVAEAVDCIIKDDIKEAMNKFNSFSVD